MVKGKLRAIVVGVSAYADDLEPLLYPLEDARLMKSLLAYAARSLDIESNIRLRLNPTMNELLHELPSFLEESVPEDVVILYFAGHAVRVKTDTFLAFKGASAEAIRRDRWATTQGLKMTGGGALTQTSLMQPCRAGQIALILDCCHAGDALRSRSPGGDPYSESLAASVVDPSGLEDATRFTVLAACSRDEDAREDDSIQHGIFTYEFNRAAREIASKRPASMADTFELITTRLKGQTPQLRGRHAAELIMLGQPVSTINLVNYHEPLSVENKSMFSIPAHPLEAQTDLVHGLISRLHGHGQPVSATATVDAIRAEVSAAGAALIRYGPSGATPVAITGMMSEADLSTDAVLRNLEDGIRDPEILPRGANTIQIAANPCGTDPDLVYQAIVVNRAETVHILYLTEVDSRLQAVNYPGSVVLASLVAEVLRAETPLDEVAHEALVLDRLQREFRFVPERMYRNRFELFKQQCEPLAMFFEPIVDIAGVDSTSVARRRASVWGWEALARLAPSTGGIDDPELDEWDCQSARDVLEAASQWRREFKAHIDSLAVQRALETFRLCRDRFSIPEPHMFSINVHPQSLLDETYLDSVERFLVEKNNLPRDRIFLELSEQEALPEPPEGGGLVRLEELERQRHLEKYLGKVRKRLGIAGFSVDDFGQGWASPERLTILQPPAVKIDRSILHLDDAEHFLEYVVNLVEPRTARHVIVEGVDGRTRLSLNHILRAGVRKAQGYALGRPTRNLLECVREVPGRVDTLLGRTVEGE